MVSDEEEARDKEERSTKKREETTMNGTLGENDLPPQVAAASVL